MEIIHRNYLTNKQVINSRTGRYYNYFEANTETQLRLFDKGFKYFYKKKLGCFGTNVLLKVIGTKVIEKQEYMICINTIGMEYLLLPEDLHLNDVFNLLCKLKL